MKKLIPIIAICLGATFAAQAQIRTCKLTPQTDVRKETGSAIITKTETSNVMQLVSGVVVEEELNPALISETEPLREEIDTLPDVSERLQDIKIIETVPDHDAAPMVQIIDGMIPEMNIDQPIAVSEITIEEKMSETAAQEMPVVCVERVATITDEPDVLVEHASCKYIGEIDAVEVTGEEISQEIEEQAKHLDQGTGTGIDSERSAFGGELRLFPNPAINTINVDFSDYESASKMQVFDMTGKMVRATYIHSNRTTILRDNLSKGMYVVRILDQDNSVLDTARFSFQ